MDTHHTTLNPTALGIAFGLVWGGAIAVLAMISRIGWGAELQAIAEDLYVGYDETSSGVVIGAIWGFADGLVCGVLVGWLYNILDRIG